MTFLLYVPGSLAVLLYPQATTMSDSLLPELGSVLPLTAAEPKFAKVENFALASSICIFPWQHKVRLLFPLLRPRIGFEVEDTTCVTLSKLLNLSVSMSSSEMGMLASCLLGPL